MVKRTTKATPPPKNKGNTKSNVKGTVVSSSPVESPSAAPFPPATPLAPSAAPSHPVLTEMPPTFEELLTACVMARRNDSAYFSTRQAMHMLLVDPRGSLVEINDGYKDAAGNSAFRASELGERVWSQLGLGSTAEQPPAEAPLQTEPAPPSAPTPLQTEPAPLQTEPAPQQKRIHTPIPSLRVQADVPIPARGQGRQSKYGFEHLKPGESFFLGIGEDGVHPSKRIPGAVTVANKRLAPMKFIYRSVNEQVDGTIVPGVRIWRVDGTPFSG